MAKTCCCGNKTTHRSDEERKKLIHRLNRIEGQIRGLRGMIEADAYCTDVLTQSAAAAAAGRRWWLWAAAQPLYTARQCFLVCAVPCGTEIWRRHTMAFMNFILSLRL